MPIRLTFALRAESNPVWSPDGRQIAFNSDQGGVNQIYRKNADGTGPEEQLTFGRNGMIPTDWSRDGRHVMYAETNPKTGTHLWAVPLVGDKKPILISAGPPNEFNGRFSPDGKWIAYDSNETGRSEVYVQAAPWTTATPGTKWSVSNQGGASPKWRGDGQELFYVAPGGKMMAAAIRMTPEGLKSDVPRPLFSFAPGPYEVTDDGQRFLIREASAAAPAPLTVVVNWQGALRK